MQAQPARQPLSKIASAGVLLLALAVSGLVPRAARGAGLLVADGPFGGVLDIKDHQVDVVINNGIAVTTVHQTFVNTENRIVEALYTFPVPKDASVADFSMWINGVEMIGEVVEKQRAREIYNSYKQQPRPRDPGLLEQVSYKTFELRVFPINPRAEQRIKVVYYQELDFDHDWATYVYPLATTTRGDINQTASERLAVNLQVRSEVPIDEMSSTSHGDQVVIAKHTRHVYEASLETSRGDLSRDLVLAFRTSRPRTGLDTITSRPAGEDGYFMMTLTAGEELAGIPGVSDAMDYVFLLDVSGSMANDSKLRLSRGSLNSFIGALGPQDRFEVMCFNVMPTTLFSELRPAGDDAKRQAAAFLDSQQARGGTQLAPAMTTAYKYRDPDRPLVVVVLSDGMTDQGERQALLQLIRQRPDNARVFAIGVGNDVNRPLLSQIAQDAGGIAAFLSRGDDFERQAQAFRRKLVRPVITDLSITIDGVDAYDIEPLQLSNLYHGAPIRLYGRYRNPGTAKVTIRGDVLGKAVSQQVAVELPAKADGNPEIERMWAWHRVDRLLKDADRTGSQNAVIDEVVRLGEGYSIVTEYTSFLVLENDGEYQRWNVKRRNATRVVRDRAAQQAVRDELDHIRRRAANDLGPAAPGSIAQANTATQPVQSTPAVQDAPTAAPSRGVDVSFDAAPSGGRNGGGGGGGAIDPVSGSLAALLAAAAWLGARNRKPRNPVGR